MRILPFTGKIRVRALPHPANSIFKKELSSLVLIGY